MGQIWNFTRIEYAQNYESKIEYSGALNSIRILNVVEMSCQKAASSRGYGHKFKPELSASWP